MKLDAKNEMARQYLIRIEETLGNLKDKAVDEALALISSGAYGKAIEQILFSQMVSPTDTGISDTKNQLDELLVGRFLSKANYETFLKGLRAAIAQHDTEALTIWEPLKESQTDNEIFSSYYQKVKGRSAPSK